MSGSLHAARPDEERQLAVTEATVLRVPAKLLWAVLVALLAATITVTVAITQGAFEFRGLHEVTSQHSKDIRDLKDQTAEIKAESRADFQALKDKVSSVQEVVEDVRAHLAPKKGLPDERHTEIRRRRADAGRASAEAP